MKKPRTRQKGFKDYKRFLRKKVLVDRKVQQTDFFWKGLSKKRKKEKGIFFGFKNFFQN